MWYARAVSLFLGLSALLSGVRAAPALPEKVMFSNITRNHGMRPGEIRALLQDRRGNHWMATASGLSRFDGIELTHYEATEGRMQVPRNIVALAQDVEDCLWLGSDGQGLCRFEPGWGVRDRFDVTHGLAHDCVTSLQTDASNSLWIGTRAGLNWMDRKTLRMQSVRIQEHSGLEEVLAIELGEDGTLWAALARRGIYRRTGGGHWNRMWNSASAEIRTELGPDGHLWAFVDEEGLMEISESGEVHIHEIPRWVLDPSHRSAEVLALEADTFGNVWLGTAHGLLKYAVSEQRWTRFKHRQGNPGSLVNGRITCLLEDQRSLLWAGSGDGELSWHPLTRYWFPGFSAEPEGLYSNEILGFCQSRDGGVWIATGRGLNRFDATTGEISRVPLERGELVNQYKETLCVLEDHSGRLWAGTRKDGVAMREPGDREFRFFRHSSQEEGSLPEGAVGALHEDHLGQIWVAVLGRGIARFSPDDEHFQVCAPAGREAELLFVNDFENDGTQGMWVATVGGGLWHLDTGNGLLQPLRSRLPLQQNLPCDNVLDVLRSRDGDLWIGTFGGGLARLHPDTGQLERFDQWDGRLPDGSACGLVEDPAGMIWVATAGGLLRIDPRQGGVRRFGVQDGLQSTVFRSRSGLRLPDGRLLLGGLNGFNVVDPDRLPAELVAPRPLLAGLELNGEPVKPQPGSGLLEKPLALTDELRIPYDAHMRFALRYGTVCFADEGQVWFRFRMDPLDASWQKGTQDLRAAYQGLKPGPYQFVVQSSQDGQNWNGPTSSIRVVILPPWFRTWWATLLEGILLAASIAGAGLYFYRRKLAEQQAENARIEDERNRAEDALARQLQYSTLMGQTVAESRKRLDPKVVFEGTLERLTTHLRLTRCRIFWQPEGKLEGRVLAKYAVHHPNPNPNPESASAEQPVWPGLQSLATVIGSEEPVALQRKQALTSEASLREWRQIWGDEVTSVLAVRTVYDERPNGILTLEVCGEERNWNHDERRLAESIAGHLGLVLAQFDLHERESHYRRELEEARQNADKANKAKGEFLAKMTHELRTPLSAIVGFAQLLDQDGWSNPEQHEALEMISHSAEYLLGVINEVLEISKLEAGKAVLVNEEIDFPKTLRRVHGMLSMTAERKGLRFELVPLNDLPATVEIDRSKLQQILVNLLSNAVKFTQKGGVSLRVMSQPDDAGPEPPGGSNRRRVELVFEVLDTGSGIAQEEIAGLFRDFVQTQTGRRSQQGTGLGLAIAKGFAELMGGTIKVVSRLGLGTLFTVRLPAWEVLSPSQKQSANNPADRSARKANESAASIPPGVRVLVAEDQAPNRLLLRKLLQRVNCVLEEAENGVQAVEKWKSFQPDVILMDESMPLMTGTAAARQILAASGERRPVIISLTAFAMTEQREAALAAGCTDFLSKPFTQEDLYAMLAKYAPPRRELRQAA